MVVGVFVAVARSIVSVGGERSGKYLGNCVLTGAPPSVVPPSHHSYV
jgi:hypothetical protein